MSREQIFREALTLSPSDRETLIDALLVSADEITTTEIEELWKNEGERRLDMISRGETQTYDGREVLRDLRASRPA
jgi:hypothetical protein